MKETKELIEFLNLLAYQYQCFSGIQYQITACIIRCQIEDLKEE